MCAGGCLRSGPWRFGNEIVEVGTPHGASLARQMAGHLRSLDGSRLVTNAMNAALTVG